MMYARMAAATGDTNLDYDSFVAALTAFGSGQMNSLSAAMRRAGLPNVPGNLNSVMAYAARQIATGNALRGADAASAAGQSAEGEMEEAASLKSELKASASDDEKYDYLKPFAEQIEDVIQGKHPVDDTILIGGTPKVLRDIDFTSLPLGLAKGHAKEMLGLIKRDKDHEFGKEFVKRLPELVNKPVAVIESRSEKANKKESSVVLILDDYNPNTNNHVIGAVEVGRELTFNDLPFDGHLITSVHGRENALNMLKHALNTEISDKHGVYYIDQKRANQLAKDPQINAAIANRLNTLGKDGSIHSIRDAGSAVKVFPKKQTETKQFDRWFWKSLVKNPDGTAKVMYHGTASDFWAFDMKKSNDKTGRRLGLGAGANKIYLTEYEASAKMAASGAADCKG